MQSTSSADSESIVLVDLLATPTSDVPVADVTRGGEARNDRDDPREDCPSLPVIVEMCAWMTKRTSRSPGGQ